MTIHNDLTLGQYDIKVIGNSTLPSNRWARFEYYMQLYQSGLIDQIEVLKRNITGETIECIGPEVLNFK